MRPVAHENAFPVGGKADAHGTEIFRRVLKKILARLDAVSAAVAGNLHAEDLALAEIGEEKIVLIFRGKRIFGVSESACGGAGAEIGHHPQGIWPARDEV